MSSLVIADLNPNTWRDTLVTTLAAMKLEGADVHGVFYTDGGCFPSPRGIGYWGLHGYLYTHDEVKMGHGLKGFVPTAKGYKESSLGHKHPEVANVILYADGTGNVPAPSTNNVAELLGAVYAFELAIDLKLKSAHFFLDSKYVLDGMKDVEKWVRNGWRRADGEPVKNSDIWKRLHALRLKMLDMMTVQFTWVKGHSGELGNEMADMWATAGRYAGQRDDLDHHNVFLSSPKKYWQPDNDYHRFFAESYWYFNATEPTTIDGKTVYHLGNHGKDRSDFGKPKAETTMSVVAIPTAEPTLEILRRECHAMDGDIGSVYTAVLGTVLRPISFGRLNAHGCAYLGKERDGLDIIDPEKRLLAQTMMPTFQAYRGMDELLILENVLREFSRPEGLGGNKRLTDITGLLYEEVVVKKKTEVKLKLSNDETTSLDAVATYHSNTKNCDATAKVVLTSGLDMPKRNTLSALADSDTKVYLITWPEDCALDAFRYATIITSPTLGIGIWAGVYSNFRIVI